MNQATRSIPPDTRRALVSAADAAGRIYAAVASGKGDEEVRRAIAECGNEQQRKAVDRWPLVGDRDIVQRCRPSFCIFADLLNDDLAGDIVDTLRFTGSGAVENTKRQLDRPIDMLHRRIQR